MSITGAAAPEPTPTFTYYVGTGISGQNLGATAPKNVGTYTVVASTTANAANNAATSAPVTFQITPASLTATASAANKTYDTTNAATVSIVLGGVLGVDVVSGSAIGTFADKNVGTGKTVTVGTVTLSGADAANYTVGAANNPTANITAASLTATASAANKTYDTTNAATVSIVLGGVLGSDVVSGSATGTFADKNVGTGKTVTVGIHTFRC